MKPEPNASCALEPTQARRARGLVQEVVQTLADSIQQGALQGGDKLPTETEIMRRFDVSRSVVRESIARLQARQLVETRHGIGTFVRAAAAGGGFKLAPIDVATLTEVMAMLELRMSLETEAAGLAAQRRQASHLRALQAQLQRFHQCIEDESDPVPADFGFHLEVAHAAGNRHFVDLMTYLGSMVIPKAMVNTAIKAPAAQLNSIWKVHSEHENIFHAIQSQDPDAARSAMRTHLSNSKERLRSSHSGGA